MRRATSMQESAHPRLSLTNLDADQPALLRTALRSLMPGEYLCVRLRGISMSPFVRHGELTQVGRPVLPLRRGMVLICGEAGHACVMHRVLRVRSSAHGVGVLTKGDAQDCDDGRRHEADVLAQVLRVSRRGRWVPIDRGWRFWVGWLYSWLSPYSRLVYGPVRRLGDVAIAPAGRGRRRPRRPGKGTP